MLLHTTTPFRLASLYWRPKPNQWTHTLIAKITYHILPGQCQVAETQDDIHPHDNHWDDDTNKSLFAPCDLIPCKPRADILLVGHAFAPPPHPTHAFTARFSTSEFSKCIEVHSDRIVTPQGRLLPGEPIQKMSLRYERSALDPISNPVGRSCDPSDNNAQRTLPNLQPPNSIIAPNNYRIAPIGFGPIAPLWPVRRQYLANPAAEQWAMGGWDRAPLPDGLEYPFFNSAPPDQQLSTIHVGCTVVLEHLHPKYPHLKTRLGGLRPRALVERPGVPPVSFLMHADTLWIDTDRAVCTVTFRWQFAVDHPDQPGRITITSELMDQRASFSEIHSAPLQPPFAATPSDGDGQTTPAPPSAPHSAVLPFAKGSATPSFPPPAKSQNHRPPRSLNATQTIAPPPALATGELPFRARMDSNPNILNNKSNELIHPVVEHLPDLPQRPLARPSLVERPTLAVEAKPEEGFSNIAAQMPATNPPALKKGRAAKPVVASNAQLKESRQAAVPESAVQASNSALGPNTQMAKEPDRRPAADSAVRPIPTGPRTAVEVLGFQAAHLDRIRKNSDWKHILSNLRTKPRDADAEGENTSERQRKDAKDRRDIAGILAMGAAESPQTLKMRLCDAVDEDGMFVSPLVLMTGELEVSFDRLEYLKMLIGVLTPLSASDKGLKDLLDSISDLIKLNVLRASGQGADNQSARIRDYFAQGQKSQLLQQLDLSVSQMLLEERQFQRKTLSGQAWVRALLYAQGSEEKKPIVVYLNDEIARELPLYPRFLARVIGELRLPQDNNESSPCALLAIALGRVVPDTMLRS